MLIKTTYKEQVYQQLKMKILNGELEQDKLYSEQHFAELFKVSRTPVREALLQLQSEDYLEIIPNRGAKILNFSIQNLYELCQAREAIENYCIDYLAQHYKEEFAQKQFQKLEDNITKTETIGASFDESGVSVDAYISLLMDLFQEFNELLLEPMENAIFDSFFDKYAGRQRIFDLRCSQVKGQMRRAIQDHRNILIAMQKGDSTAACTFNKAHIFNALSAVSNNSID